MTSKTFKEIEKDGIFILKCENCTAHCSVDERETHECKPEDLENKIKREQEIFTKWVDKLQVAFPTYKVENICREILNEKIGAIERMRDFCFVEYEDMIKQGVPLKERREKLDIKQIDWCNKNIDIYKNYLKTHKVVPFKDWLQFGDHYSITRNGLKLFIEMWLDKCCEPIEIKSDNGIPKIDEI
jgi:hypothetical protein